jgi:hypothetical protein
VSPLGQVRTPKSISSASGDRIALESLAVTARAKCSPIVVVSGLASRELEILRIVS